MASVSEQLLEALDDLVTDELKRFKWHLRNHKVFSAAALENADAPDTVDLMMKRFGPEKALKMTVDILRKMNHNHVAEQLENKQKQTQAEEPVLVEPSSNLIRGSFTKIVPRTRNDLIRYYHRLTLDLKTVNKHLHLSENNRVITGSDSDQLYPDHPDRFDVSPQVLCRESVCGRCYWEIEWSGSAGVYISVSYQSISRKGGGDKCEFGRNDQSWSLFCSPSCYSFIHNNIWNELHVGRSISSRIGVYVDYSAGSLSFYSVSDSMSLIHTVQTTFTQPLYPGFNVRYGSVELC
ncbi:stonustoxin subunit alpha-like [Carassius auratus]|uniref:Stonustoxin subunit alpha-like n=1 Tax=Carassius auratus TaxID=7957 RepID=A0A6P6MEX2_CARAU|nr:stonustoxin subunit alpha-like [Carassius auratus]